jgi:hypothetical protein
MSEEEDQMAQSRQAAAPPVEEPKPTKRMVLQRAKVVVIDGDVPDDVLKQAVEALRRVATKTHALVKEAWLECGVHEGRSKNDSIEAYTGKAGTPDAKPGAYKAVPAASFAGGLLLKVPEKPLVESEAIE